ncbi:MAG: TIGR04255 family protein [Methylobacteriaceae bacterium]|nr:TIGR04255 family protein [Methylobacteriaceae bacterium]
MKRLRPRRLGRVKFKNPPINELVISLFHLPLIEMKAQHIGVYWDRIRDRYPNCDQQPPVSLNATFPEASGEIFPLPRFWFHSGPGSTLIQVQRDAFMFNWRKAGENEYPHYESVRQRFYEELDVYLAFLQAAFGHTIDVVNRSELTYMNVVTQNDFWSTPPEIGNLVPPLSGLAMLPGTGRLSGVNSTSTYQVAENLHVDLAVRLGRRIDTSEIVAMLEIKAHGTPEGLSLSAIGPWLDAAHAAALELFLNATNKDVQKMIWKPS